MILILPYQIALNILILMNSKQEVWKYPNLPPKPFVFQRKISLLDEGNPESVLNQSKIRGFFNLAIIFLMIFFITQPVVNFIEYGYFLDPTLYQSFKIDFIFCLFTWPLFFFWSFTSFILQKLIILGLNKKVSLVLQHTTQSGLFIYSIYVVFANDWCSTHATFVVLQACAHFMKMHSYITVNRDLMEQWQQSKQKQTKPKSNYPQNITLKNFIVYMFTPWLVYAEYPRKQTIDFFYALKKIGISAVLLLVIYIINAQFIQPWILMGQKISLIELLLKLMLPCTAFIILAFYLVFQNYCNFFAEITMLDSRQFYEDWWNSQTFEQFNRKWNKPVHYFLYRHVYLESMIRWKRSKVTAQIFTFLFSACLHQFLLAVIFRIVRPIFLGFIILQVPLIKLTKWMEKSRSGQYLFWFGIILGPTLILCSYLRVDQRVTKMFTQY